MQKHSGGDRRRWIDLLWLSKETKNMRTKQLCSTAGFTSEKSALGLANSQEKDGCHPTLSPPQGDANCTHRVGTQAPNSTALSHSHVPNSGGFSFPWWSLTAMLHKCSMSDVLFHPAVLLVDVCLLVLSPANQAICHWLPGNHRSLQPCHRAQMHPGSSQLVFTGKYNLLGKSSASASCKELLCPPASLPRQEITANHVSETGRSPAHIFTLSEA